MSKKSRRKRERLRQRKLNAGRPVMMLPVEGSFGIQQCPKCLTTLKGQAIKDRICFRCSPKQADAQLQAHKASQEHAEASQTKSMDPSNPNHVNAEYDRRELHLRGTHKEYGLPVPDVFENWRIYFFSRGSALREWERILPLWLKGYRDTKPVTDMTPNHILEAKIKERRDAMGRGGPAFTTIETIVRNSGTSATEMTGSSWKSQSCYVRPKKQPALPLPTGMDGQEHHII